jgi:alkylation response protein AidB-like acyl-CoA dehydrogenase
LTPKTNGLDRTAKRARVRPVRIIAEQGTTMIMTKPTDRNWTRVALELGADFARRAAEHDEAGSFVEENYVALREHGFLAAAVPEELGGGGVSHGTMCDLLRILAHSCAATALSLSMHQHLVAANVWKYRRGQGASEMLEGVATRQPVLVSTGASDWLNSNGEMVKAEGGYRVTATKRFASQSAVGDLLVTSAPCRNPGEDWQVLHFTVPLKSTGVRRLDDWDTLGMRGTGSHTVQLDGVLVPESAITLRRPRGQHHPIFDVVVTVALPLIMSVYVGIAQKAAREAIAFARRKPAAGAQWPGAIGAMLNRLTCAEVHLQDMIRLARDLDFTPSERLGQDVLARKSNVANACIDVVTRAMEIVGGTAFYREFGLERLFRDVQAARYHPLPELEQQRVLGEFALRERPPENP